MRLIISIIIVVIMISIVAVIIVTVLFVVFLSLLIYGHLLTINSDSRSGGGGGIEHNTNDNSIYDDLDFRHRFADILDVNKTFYTLTTSTKNSVMSDISETESIATNINEDDEYIEDVFM